MFGAVAAGVPSFGDLAWKSPVRAVQVGAFPSQTTTAQTISRSGNGALPDVDGVSLALGDRLLVAAQTNGYVEGIYYVTDLGSGSTPWILTRTADCDTADEMVVGATVYIAEGDKWAGTTAVAGADWTPTTGDADWRPYPQLRSTRTVYTGDDTWTRSNPNATVVVTVVGGGGGGGGTAATSGTQMASGGGGAGGGCAILRYAPEDTAATADVVVGNGGAVSNGAGGGDGGTSTFTMDGGITVAAAGGTGGAVGNATGTQSRALGGIGGAAAGGDTNFPGDDGGNGMTLTGQSVPMGHGGGSYLAGQTRTTSTGDGLAGQDYGGGGSGAQAGNSNSSRPGGVGGVGIVIVEEFWIGAGVFA